MALDGYCPVQLAANERWVLGDPRWGLLHRGRTYLFAGPEECRRFDADPDRYAPVLSGNDVVLLAEEGRMVPGYREYGAWVGDNPGPSSEKRVYLFAGEETYQRFLAAPDRYVNVLPQLVQETAPQSPNVGPAGLAPGTVPVGATRAPYRDNRY